MSAILEQLGLDQTFFFQFGLFAVVFFFLANVYFKPFLKLFEQRHQKTVADREAADKLLEDAEARLDDYTQRIHEARLAARKEYENILAAARKEETEILARAREEAKKITQDAAESATRQREDLKRQLEVDVESIAHKISETLLLRKA